MEKNIFAPLIAQQLNLQERAVDNTLSLLDEGCTIPFISRYRKERTGGLDEVQIAAISTQYERFKEIQKRKETVVKTISDLGKLTPELEKRIADCWDATELEAKYGKNPQDTGSTEVQVALLTARIKELTEHLKNNKQDNHSRRGLYKMVGQRRGLLDYLKSKDINAYRALIEKLDIRK